jgi:hypothetical protein
MFIVLAATASRDIFVFTILVILCVVLDSTFFTLVAFASLICFALAHFVLDLYLICYLLPYSINAVSVGEPLENAVTANHNIVIVVLDLETFDVWVADNHIWVSTIAWTLSFDIAKCLRYRESSWEDSKWPLHIKILLTWMSSCFCKCLSSINFATSCLNSDLLKLIIWLVITG